MLEHHAQHLRVRAAFDDEMSLRAFDAQAATPRLPSRIDHRRRTLGNRGRSYVHRQQSNFTRLRRPQPRRAVSIGKGPSGQ